MKREKDKRMIYVTCTQRKQNKCILLSERRPKKVIYCTITTLALGKSKRLRQWPLETMWEEQMVETLTWDTGSGRVWGRKRDYISNFHTAFLIQSQGSARWFQKQRCLPQSLATWAWIPKPTERTERTVFSPKADFWHPRVHCGPSMPARIHTMNKWVNINWKANP